MVHHLGVFKGFRLYAVDRGQVNFFRGKGCGGGRQHNRASKKESFCVVHRVIQRIAGGQPGYNSKNR